MKVEQQPFGRTADGTQVDLFTLSSARGMTVKVITYGAIVTSVVVPDRQGNPGEVTLGFDSLDEYLAGHPYLGCVCGRVANRIARGRFTIDGVEYRLAVNNGDNHLHGGLRGFDKVVWRARPIEGEGEAGVRLSYRSHDGEEGYPGNLDVTLSYVLTGENELRLEYTALSDKPTPINLTNHAYWNLADGGKSDVLGHELEIVADRYLPVDSGSIPTGELRPVAGTPMEFSSPTPVGARIDEIGGDPGGYDHCYVLHTGERSEPALAARLYDPVSGRVMEVLTTEPGIQLYTGNYLDGSRSSRGAVFGKRHGLCLETQHFPDSINQPAFPSTLLVPGETFRSTTVHRFGVR